MTEKDIIKHCSSTDKISGDPLDEDGSTIYLVHEGSSAIECYDKDELYEWFKSQERLFVYIDKPDFTRRVFKMSWSGVWVDQQVYDLIFNVGYRALFLYKKQLIGIGSFFGVSRTHGTIEQIYAGIPVSISQLHDINKLRDEIRKLLPGTTSLNNPDKLKLFRNLLSNEEEEEEEEEEDQDIDMPDNEIETVYGKLENCDAPISVLNTEVILSKGFNPDELNTLTIRNCKIDKVELHDLVDDFTDLITLTLDNCGLKDMKGLPNLDELSLNNNQITHISDIKNYSTTILELENNQLTEIDNLNKMGLYGLRTLKLRGNNILEIGPKSGVDEMANLKYIQCEPTVINNTYYYTYDANEYGLVRSFSFF
jgi:hypothetical protein